MTIFFHSSKQNHFEKGCRCLQDYHHSSELNSLQPQGNSFFILSNQNAFSNETTILRYIKVLKAEACTLQFQNKKPITEIINNQVQEWIVKIRKLGIMDSNHFILTHAQVSFKLYWLLVTLTVLLTRNKFKFNKIQVTSVCVHYRGNERGIYSLISHVYKYKSLFS